MPRTLLILLVLGSFGARAQAPAPDSMRRVPPVRLEALPPDLATKQFGFFCRQELKWDKKLPVPVRFRLGSQESCDRLEGKQCP